MEKTSHPKALDRFRGKAFVEQYASWKCVRQIKPRGIKFFQLIFLAHVVHLEAPIYTSLQDNCYWFVTTVIDSVEGHFGVDTVEPLSCEDSWRENRYSFDSDLTGRWMGMKITTSNPSQISVIVSKYQEAYANQITQV